MLGETNSLDSGVDMEELIAKTEEEHPPYKGPKMILDEEPSTDSVVKGYCNKLDELFRSRSELVEDIKYLRTAKIRETAYEMPAPNFWDDASLREKFDELRAEYYRTYQPPDGKVLIHFSCNFGTYSWPSPYLLTEEEAEKKYCPFYQDEENPEKSRDNPKLPTSAKQLKRQLFEVTKCPCKKEKCFLWLHKLHMMDIHRRFIKQTYEELMAQLFEKDIFKHIGQAPDIGSVTPPN